MPKRDSLPVYKIALYGPSSSGKTCYIAALAMRSILSPRRTTATWIENPIGDGYLPESDDSVRQIFGNSASLLKEAISALRSGEAPKATPDGVGDIRFIFSLSAPETSSFPGRSNFLVEIIDYSGELIDARLNENANARNLKKRLEDMDALIVLAQTPRQEQTSTDIMADGLDVLEASFSALAKDTASKKLGRAPVLLAVNKWDRAGAIEYKNPENEKSKLSQLLLTPSFTGQATLQSVISGAVPPKGFELSPVSAFGESKFVGVGKELEELPVQSEPLKSFGLSDAIVDIVGLKDELDLRRLADNTRKAAFWKLWDPAALGTVKPNISDLKLRYKNRENKEITGDGPAAGLTPELVFSSARTKRIKVASAQLMSIALFLIGAQQATQVYLDRPDYLDFVAFDEKIETDELKQNIDVDELRTQENWLCNYSQELKPFARFSTYLFQLSAAKAGRKCNDYRSAREKILGDELEALLEGSEERASAAKRYIDHFGESGPRIQAARISQNLWKWSAELDLAEADLIEKSQRLSQLLSDGAALSGSFERLGNELVKIELPNIAEIESELDPYRSLRDRKRDLSREMAKLLETVNSEKTIRLCNETWIGIEDSLSRGAFSDTVETYHIFSASECHREGRSLSDLSRLIRAYTSSYALNNLANGKYSSIANDIRVVQESSMSTESAFVDVSLKRDLGLLLEYLEKLAERDAYEKLRVSWNSWDPLNSSGNHLNELFQNFDQSGRLTYGTQVDRAKAKYESLQGPQSVSVRWYRIYSTQFQDYDFIATLDVGQTRIGSTWLDFDTASSRTQSVRVNYSARVRFANLLSSEKVSASIIADAKRTYDSINPERAASRSRLNDVVSLKQLRDGYTIRLGSGTRFSSTMSIALANQSEFNLTPLPPAAPPPERPSWLTSLNSTD